MFNFTFLTRDQIFGDNRLELLREYGKAAELTDFAIALGSTPLSNNISRAKNYGVYWTSTNYRDKCSYIVTGGGSDYCKLVNKQKIGARLISRLPIEYDKNDSKEILLGNYPQTAPNYLIQQELENKYASRSLHKTGNTFTVAAQNNNSIDNKLEILEEYEYKGKKYVRIFPHESMNKFLTDKRLLCKDNPLWIEVEPVKWLIDDKTNIIVSEKILFSGIPFNNICEYDGIFETTYMKSYIDNFFSKDLLQDWKKTFYITQEQLKELMENKCIQIEESNIEIAVRPKVKKLDINKK